MTYQQIEVLVEIACHEAGFGDCLPLRYLWRLLAMRLDLEIACH